MQAIKAQIHQRLLETIDLAEASRMPEAQLQAECLRRVSVLLDELRCPLAGPDKERLVRDVMDDVFGLGPIEEFLRDRTVSDVLVNGTNHVYIERHGRLEKTSIKFRNDAHLIRVI